MNEQAKQAEISDDIVEQKVINAVVRALELDPEQVTLSSSLEKDFGAESLDYLDIAFMLEREFNIQFPREDLLKRATDYFGEFTLVSKEGLVTDLGIELLHRGMPEIDPALLKPGMRAVDLRPLFIVQTFVRVVKRLLEAKNAAPRNCPDCGAAVIESESLPQFECPNCHKVILFPTGDDVIFQDLVALDKDRKKRNNYERSS